jgi:hypothetical protein
MFSQPKSGQPDKRAKKAINGGRSADGEKVVMHSLTVFLDSGFVKQYF